MEPSERKLLFVFVRDALSGAGEDGIDTTRRNGNTVLSLRSLGLIHPQEDSLTREAFLTYFDTFEEICCPQDVQEWVTRLHVSNVRWRRPSGFMISQMGQGRGKTYAPLATVFIGEKANRLTWFHELGHILFPRIDVQKMAALKAVAMECFDVISSDEAKGAIDPNTMKPISLPVGTYLKMNGHYYGLDHSGPGPEAESDELWAILFGEYCHGLHYPPSLQAILDEIIYALTTALS